MAVVDSGGTCVWMFQGLCMFWKANCPYLLRLTSIILWKLPQYHVWPFLQPTTGQPFDAKAQADPSTDRVPHCSGPLRIQVPVPWKHPRTALVQTGDLLKFIQIIKVSSGTGNHPQIRWPRFRLVNCDNLSIYKIGDQTISRQFLFRRSRKY
jgi:hypothetical protein